MPKTQTNNRNWQQDLARNLARYYRDKGYAASLRYPWVLARRADWHKNIIVPEVWRYIEKQRRERRKKRVSMALLRWLHHGFSSQAFLFNLLGPLIIDEQWQILDEIIREAGIKLATGITNADFELEDREVFNELRGQPTSVDLCLYAGDEEKVFAEFKFTEKTFGWCSIFNSGGCDGKNPANDFDLCYLHHTGKKYWLLMKKHRLLTEQIKKSLQCPFATLYQLYRLILFALEKKGHFLLLYDERNPCYLVKQDDINRGLFNVVYESLPPGARRKCHALPVQRILPILKKHSELEWTAELEKKYFQRQGKA